MSRILALIPFVIGTTYLGLGAFFSFIEGRLNSLYPVNEFYIGAALLLLLFSFRVRDFYYDDRYEIFTIKNPRVLLPFLERQVKTHLELPKKQIMSYRISNYGVYKKLTIYFASYRGDFKVKHFHLYAITSRTWQAIQNNLDLLVKTNNPESHQSNLD